VGLGAKQDAVSWALRSAAQQRTADCIPLSIVGRICGLWLFCGGFADIEEPYEPCKVIGGCLQTSMTAAHLLISLRTARTVQAEVSARQRRPRTALGTGTTQNFAEGGNQKESHSPQ